MRTNSYRKISRILIPFGIALLFQNVNGGGWIKLNDHALCVGARGDKFGAVTFNNSCLHEDTMFASFKFKHRSGHVRCVDDAAAKSKWGCTTKTFDGCLAMLITDEENNVLFPKKRLTQFRDVYNLDLYYEIPTFDQNSQVFVLSDFTSPLSVEQGKTLRIWYSEDLTENPSSKDNHGTVCFDLYALVVLPPNHI